MSKKSSSHNKHNSEIPSSKISSFNNNQSNILNSIKINENKKPSIANNHLVSGQQIIKNYSKSPRLNEKVDLIKKRIEDSKINNNDSKNHPLHNHFGKYIDSPRRLHNQYLLQYRDWRENIFY